MSNAAVHIFSVLRLRSALLREGNSLRAAALSENSPGVAARYHREG